MDRQKVWANIIVAGNTIIPMNSNFAFAYATPPTKPTIRPATPKTAKTKLAIVIAHQIAFLSSQIDLDKYTMTAERIMPLIKSRTFSISPSAIFHKIPIKIIDA